MVKGMVEMAKVRFEVEWPGANKVHITGDFNQWQAEGRRMKRVRKDGDLFVARLPLAPGRYEFKYVVDGEWVCCPKAPRVRNEHGSENSVIEVA